VSQRTLLLSTHAVADDGHPASSCFSTQNTEVAVRPFWAARAGYRLTRDQKFFLAFHTGTRMFTSGHLAISRQYRILLTSR
jgi:hypothetical protein